MASFDELDVLGAPRDLVALGGALDAGTLVSAYRAGCFPWPPSADGERALAREARRLLRRGVPLLPGAPPGRPLVPWCSPDPRAVLLTHALKVPRTLRQQLRRCGWHTTLDTAFDRVVAACADREQTWITPDLRTAYGELHRAGHAHSLEVWDGDDLVGGMYGVLTGRVFSGESMFHAVPGGSKVGLVDLCARLREAAVVVLDTQQASEHLAALGQVLVSREDYLHVVRRLRDEPVALAGDRRPVARLA